MFARQGCAINHLRQRLLFSNSIKTQLEWLLDFFEGRNEERRRLRALTFGHYAAREIDERDDEFVDAPYTRLPMLQNRQQRDLR